MNKRPPYSRRENLAIFVAALAGALLCTLAVSWYQNQDNRWFRIVSPPNETAAEILALDRGLNPYVRTAQGNLYLCTGHTWRDTCRKVTPEELPTTRMHPQWSSCGPAFPPVPAAPGVVVDSIEAGRCSEASTYGKLVLLSDGTLWEWRRTFSWVHPFALATSGVLGLGIGIVGGIILVKLRRALRDT